MILIFTYLEDYATRDIQRWLNKLTNERVLRLNSDEKNTIRINGPIDDLMISVNDIEFRIQDVTSTWYRKGFRWFRSLASQPTIAIESLNLALNQRMRDEVDKIEEYIHHQISLSAKQLGSPYLMDLNKLTILRLAQDAGLLVPPTELADCARTLEGTTENIGPCITKAIGDGLYLFDHRQTQSGYFTYTEQVNSNLAIEHEFPPSLLQGQVDKEYEIRSFYLDGHFYSMAIFSQSDSETAVDYRHYINDKPNRNIPYRLPTEIESKLRILFKKIGLNTGSVDLIKSKDGQYIFLEINPVGQFSNVSEQCNYNLEKKVAQWLAN